MSQIHHRNDFNCSTLVEDRIARLRWRVTDEQVAAGIRYHGLLAERAELDEPEHVKSFTRRWLPDLAKSKGWL